MLIEFSVGNYRSFKDKVTFSMVASNAVALDKKLDENNVFSVDDDLKLLKTAAIYGANASGKSNLAKALNFMKSFIINSSRETQSTDKIDVENFRLSTETEGQPSFFEIVFLMSGIKYRYGFEVTQDKVISEWLFYVPKKRETNLFTRNQDSFSLSKKYEGDGLQQRTRSNALFISVSAQFNVEIAENILNWLIEMMNVISGLTSFNYVGYLTRCILEENYKEQILELIKGLDIGIIDLELGKTEFTHHNLVNEIPDKPRKVEFHHKKFDTQGIKTSIELFDLRNHESEGTQKIFDLAAALLDTLKFGRILIIDEFDARLHPLISRKIVELFNSNETNPNNAQLIFMTHDTNLLSNKLFRRDQIWFTEKNRYGATDLYSLVEYKVPDDNSKIRNDASFESDYIKGRYGAIPYIGNLESLINSNG